MAAPTLQELQTWDFVVIGLYFLFVLLVGLGSMFRSNRGSTEGYFLAGGAMLWFPVGASLFASNIGSEHFIGLAGSGAASGIAVAAFELNALIIVQILGWVFLPVYLAGGVFTMPDYLRKRFGGKRIQMYTALLSLTLYIFTKISVDLYSGALFIEQALKWNLYVAIVSLLAITALYTVTGGLAAVIFTDTLQAIIMMVGAGILCVMSFIKVGGYAGLKEQYLTAYANISILDPTNECGKPPNDSFHMLREPSDDELPWPGFVFGQSVASIWYWATDQVIVQRALSAKNLSHGQGGTLMAGILKISPMFFIVMPGMISRVFYPDIVGCADPATCMAVCNSEAGCSNLAYPLLVMDILPTGLRGLMLAVMLSALMSSLTSIFNSGSTIFTMDVWRKLRSFPSDEKMRSLDKKTRRRWELELMIVGRVFVLVLVGVSILWVPVVQSSQQGQLFQYIQQISAYLSPPIAAVFILAILWERINEQGAFWSLMVGLAVGLTRMILDFVYASPGCGQPDERPVVVQKILFHYMYFALLLFGLTCLVAICISYMTEKVPPHYLYRLTYFTRFNTKERQDINDFIYGRKGSFTSSNKEHSKDNNAKEEINVYRRKGSFNSDFEQGMDNIAMDVIEVHKGEMAEEPPTYDEKGNYDKKENGLEAPDDLSISRSESGSSEAEHHSLFRKFYDWFCGFSTNDPEAEMTEEQKRAEELKLLAKLHQTKFQKAILNIFLMIVLCIAVFMYSFWA
ncbi:sodium/glucose cotransporter 4-like [Acanthaster planci]|uniref:Sodium/glucose cotransporter 4-like n=1 Tax=Acanthaster planci TaxID=133434 RepID=A0A8B7YN00_ACAPL|nr:sodium/glucose cotransporter 4-like [Acanthaster planci]